MRSLLLLIKYTLTGFLLSTLGGIILLTIANFLIQNQLPVIDELKDIHLQVPLKVFSEDGLLIAEFGEKRRSPKTYQQIPEQMLNAFVASEDEHFYQHFGVDPIGIARAVYKLILTGRKRQGGSTITMQVARNFFLSTKRSYLRKVKEIFLAVKIEKLLSKEEILEIYLNKIYLGNRSYGVGAAAEVYYGKQLNQLSLAQIAMIAGLPKAPSTYNPIANPDRAIIRRNYVLDRLLKLEHISDEAHNTARNAPITAQIHIAKPEVDALYIAEMIRSQMVEKFQENATTDGYTVITTINSQHQKYANDAVFKALHDYDVRHGFRGAEKNYGELSETAIKQTLRNTQIIGRLNAAYVLSVQEQSAEIIISNGDKATLQWDNMKWARHYETENKKKPKPKIAADILVPGDIIRVIKNTKDQWQLSQIPDIEGAFIALNPDNGAIKALVGGYHFYKSKFNRTIQAKRQPGSSFKPIIYSAALEKGYTAASIINDAHVVINDKSLEGQWSPENYDEKTYGPTRLRVGLYKSRNLISVRLLRDIKTRYAAKYATRFGFDYDKIPKNLSLALGSGSATPIQMARAYSVFANGGHMIEPYLIQTIINDKGEKIETADPAMVCDEYCQQLNAAQQQKENEADSLKKSKMAPRVITAQNNFIISSILRNVITHGTGWRAKTLNRKDIAGKTGTTNDQKDAWFCGFHPKLVAISWAGFDSTKPLGNKETGGRVAQPMWIYFMQKALKGIPEHIFKRPAGMVTVKIDKKTGKLAPSGSKEGIFETFREAYIPTEVANDSHSNTQPSNNNNAVTNTNDLDDAPIY